MVQLGWKELQVKYFVDVTLVLDGLTLSCFRFDVIGSLLVDVQVNFSTWDIRGLPVDVQANLLQIEKV